MRVIVPQCVLAENAVCFTTTKDNGGYRKLQATTQSKNLEQYSGLNLAEHVSDLPEAVQKNREILGEFISASCFSMSTKKSTDNAAKNSSFVDDTRKCRPFPLQFLKQVHSTKVVSYTGTETISNEADGVFTNKLRVPLAVLTADCLPIALVSKINNESALVHAGWRGLINGIIENALDMFGSSRHHISAWVGPSICQNHFEVGDEVAAEFAAYGDCMVSSARNKHTANRKFHIDLASVAAHKLRSLGLNNIQISEQCTYCKDELYSYRQARHSGYSDCGRMATVLVRT